MKPTAKKPSSASGRPRAANPPCEAGRLRARVKELEEAAARSAAGAATEKLLLLNKAIETTKTGITFCDRNNIIQYTNPADAEMHGYEVAELMGQDVGIFSPQGRIRSMTFDEMKAIKSWARESVNRKKDGTFFPVYLISDVVKNDAGEPVGVVTVCEDISDRKRAAHLASIGELAAGIAHEINNPANSIINYAQMLMDSTPPESRQSSIAAEVMHEGERIAKIVRNMLSFSRHREEDLSCVSVGHVLADSLSLIESQLKKQNAALDVEMPDGLPEVFLDPHKLHQVFVNILNNAWYALTRRNPDEGRRLTVKAGADDAGRLVRIRFRDNGIGIPRADLDKIFTPFFTTKPTGAGTGLGLSISQSIVKSFGGDIRVQSEEGLFTEVTVELPAEGRR